jgi:hypothetical protein
MNVSEIVIIWINNKQNIKRYDHMVSQLEKYFPNNKKIHVDAILETPKHNGVSMAHMISILKGINTKKPFLILEDDVSIDAERLNFLKLENELQKLNTTYDALYMGLSSWGGRKGDPDNKIELEKGAVFENINNPYFVRLHSMYSAHAILYINPEYAIETTKLCITAIFLNRPHDIYLYKLFKKYNVIGLRSPWFYQDIHYNGQEKYTRINV